MLIIYRSETEDTSEFDDLRAMIREKNSLAALQSSSILLANVCPESPCNEARFVAPEIVAFDFTSIIRDINAALIGDIGLFAKLQEPVLPAERNVISESVANNIRKSQNEIPDSIEEKIKNFSCQHLNDSIEITTVFNSTRPIDNPCILNTTRPIENPCILNSTQPIENPSILNITRPIENPSILNTTKPIENPSILNITRPIENPCILNSTKPIENPSILNTTKLIENPCILNSTRPIENPSILNTTKPIENPSILNITRPIENPSILNTTKLIENPCILNTTRPIENPSILNTTRPIENPSILNTTKLIENPCILNTTKLIENPCILNTTKLIENPSILNTTRPIENPCILNTTRPIENPSILNTTELIENPSILNTTKLIENPSILNTTKLIENPSILNATKLIENPCILNTTRPLENPCILNTTRPIENPSILNATKLIIKPTILNNKVKENVSILSGTRISDSNINCIRTLLDVTFPIENATVDIVTTMNVTRTRDPNPTQTSSVDGIAATEPKDSPSPQLRSSIESRLFSSKIVDGCDVGNGRVGDRSVDCHKHIGVAQITSTPLPSFPETRGSFGVDASAFDFISPLDVAGSSTLAIRRSLRPRRVAEATTSGVVTPCTRRPTSVEATGRRQLEVQRRNARPRSPTPRTDELRCRKSTLSATNETGGRANPRKSTINRADPRRSVALQTEIKSSAEHNSSRVGSSRGRVELKKSTVRRSLVSTSSVGRAQLRRSVIPCDVASDKENQQPIAKLKSSSKLFQPSKISQNVYL